MLLEFMYRSIPTVIIPRPGKPPGELTFLKNFGQILHYARGKHSQMSHHAGRKHSQYIHCM